MDQLLTKEPEEKEWQTLYELLWTHRSNGIFSKQEYSVPRCHYDEHPESDDESFPTTFTSISLHPVDWPAKLPCQEARILVRPCFYEMYEEMKSCEGSLAIFGEIFTGKRDFLLYVLVRRLLERQTTTIQFRKNEVHCFSESGAFVVSAEDIDLKDHYGAVRSMLHDDTAMHLIDCYPFSNRNTRPPLPKWQGAVIYGECPVDAPTGRSSEDWAPFIRWLPPLSWSEVHVAAQWVRENSLASDLDPDNIRRAFEEYGPYLYPTMHRLYAQTAARELKEQHGYEWPLDARNNSIYEDSDIFLSHPMGKTAIAAPESSFAVSALLYETDALERNTIVFMLEQLGKFASTKPIATRVFQTLVNDKLCRADCSMKISQFPEEKRYKKPQKRLHIKNTPSNWFGLSTKPRTLRFPATHSSVGSITIGKDHRLWLFHTPLGDSYVRVSDLNFILTTLFEEDHPTEERKAALVVVALEGWEPSRSPKIVGDTNGWWHERLEKYIVTVDRKWLVRN